MKIKSITIENFRSYGEKTIVEFNDLTAFVGKNDVGKSSVLEALDVFFHDGKGTIKLDKEDINVGCKKSGNVDIEITISFTDLPSKITIDETNETSLIDEYLLDSKNNLTIKKLFKNASTPKVFIVANHPNNSHCCDLLQKKQSDLVKMIKDLGLECEDKRRNAVMRKAIWQHYIDDLQLSEKEIDISSAKEDVKEIWDKLKDILPCYSLFQSDRKNSDGDNEVQDPLKTAVKQILENNDVKNKLKDIAKIVQQTLQVISDSTLKKLKEMNPEVASTLHPNIDIEGLKWPDVFKGISIAGDNDIPINKRGSGVKRLILLNFFRAEAERQRKAEDVGIIYAIEEPETSQHKAHQKILVDSLLALSRQPNTQIILTTHSADIVKKLDFSNIRLISIDNSGHKAILPVRQRILPFPSLNEVNYLAFGDITEEYHNELYGYIQSKAIDENQDNTQEKYFDTWLSSKGCALQKVWVRIKKDGTTLPCDVTLQTYIRNCIHHPENTNNAPYTEDELKSSVQKMADVIATIV